MGCCYSLRAATRKYYLPRNILNWWINYCQFRGNSNRTKSHSHSLFTVLIQNHSKMNSYPFFRRLTNARSSSHKYYCFLICLCFVLCFFFFCSSLFVVVVVVWFCFVNIFRWCFFSFEFFCTFICFAVILSTCVHVLNLKHIFFRTVSIHIDNRSSWFSCLGGVFAALVWFCFFVCCLFVCLLAFFFFSYEIGYYICSSFVLFLC